MRVLVGRARTPCAPRRAEDCPPCLFPLRHRRITAFINLMAGNSWRRVSYSLVVLLNLILILTPDLL
jgi:hypothetical protein